MIVVIPIVLAFSMIMVGRSLMSGVYRDKWGHASRENEPIQFWLSISVWAALGLAALWVLFFFLPTAG